MLKGVRKINGFLWAMLLALISFFIIFIFFPNVSDKFFGVSLREPKKVVESVNSSIEDATSSIKDKATEVVTEVVTDVVKDTISDALDNLK